jgi:hypothetical protein
VEDNSWSIWEIQTDGTNVHPCCRAARQEPDRADLQADLVASLSRLGDLGSLQRALDILQRLDREQKLTTEKRGWIPPLEAVARKSGP